jgi:hypothetical protein
MSEITGTVQDVFRVGAVVRDLYRIKATVERIKYTDYDGGAFAGTTIGTIDCGAFADIPIPTIDLGDYA